MSVPDSIHCINPDCPSPYPQPGYNKFCQDCGTALHLDGRYIPLKHLGTGGFAAIYVVWDLQQQQERVLKVLTVASDKALQLFEQEAAVLASLRHSGIPKVEPNSFFRIPTAKRTIYCLAMEKIPGQTLEDLLMQQYPQGCPEALVLDWLVQAVEILTMLHHHQIIHRDIKPSNLMLRSPAPGMVGKAQLVLIDFGGAKQMNSADSSTRLFSSGYSPPEQIAGGLVEPAADIYALGRTAIHLLTGKYPTEMEDVQTGELQWQECAQVSSAFATLLTVMVRLNPRERPQTASDLKQRLARIPGAGVYLSGTPTQIVSAISQRTWPGFLVQLAIAGKVLAQASQLSLKAAHTIFKAGLDTSWEILSGGVGAVVGAAIGYVLANFTPLGGLFANWVTGQLPNLVAGVEVTVGKEILLFACAGWGTGCGLGKAGGFGQRKKSLAASLTGFLGYGVGWLLWVGMPYYEVARFMGLIAAAGSILTLGLGLPSHHLFHALVAGCGTGIFALGLISSGIISVDFLVEMLSFSDFRLSIVFCGLLAVSWGSFVGVSYYLIVPLLHFLERER